MDRNKCNIAFVPWRGPRWQFIKFPCLTKLTGASPNSRASRQVPMRDRAVAHKPLMRDESRPLWGAPKRSRIARRCATPPSRIAAAPKQLRMAKWSLRVFNLQFTTVNSLSRFNICRAYIVLVGSGISLLTLTSCGGGSDAPADLPVSEKLEWDKGNWNEKKWN